MSRRGKKYQPGSPTDIRITATGIPWPDEHKPDPALLKRLTVAGLHWAEQLNRSRLKQLEDILPQTSANDLGQAWTITATIRIVAGIPLGTPWFETANVMLGVLYAHVYGDAPADLHSINDQLQSLDII